jgi:hypothetical protein
VQSLRSNSQSGCTTNHADMLPHFASEYKAKVAKFGSFREFVLQALSHSLSSTALRLRGFILLQGLRRRRRRNDVLDSH